MKKFFAKATRPFSIDTDVANDPSKARSRPTKNGSSREGSSSKPTVDASNTPHITTGLQPKYTVPAVPHPVPTRPPGRCGYEGGAPDQALLQKSIEEGFEVGAHILLEDCLEDLGKWLNCHYSGEKRPKNHPSNASGPAALIDQVDRENAVIIYGIVGVLELFACSYLLVISSRGEVGNILDPTHTVYSVNGVTVIPLLEDRARIAVNTLASRNAALSRPSLIPRTTLLHPQSRRHAPDSVIPLRYLLPIPRRNSMVTSPVFKTLATRLSFWSRLSKRPAPATPADEEPDYSEFPMTDYAVPIQQPTTLAEEREALDKMMKAEEEPAKVVEAIVNATAPPPTTTEEKHKELEDKVVRECVRELTKGGMYFAYTFDITRSLQHKQEQIAKSQKQRALLGTLGALPSSSGSHTATLADTDHGAQGIYPLAEPNPALPLWRRVDKQFWWNECMAKPFIDAGVHPYVLPIMQGYIQTRSRYRAGLRYQRRGIDEEANVANFVETETIMRIEREKQQNVFSYVQIRGSIPLFWTQSGYSLKPPPVLAADRTHSQNLDALGRHFKRTVPLYGPHTIVNLAEQGGREGAITQAYREYAIEFDNSDCSYDFHRETKGMKYENISKLITTMEKVFATQGYLWISNDTALSHQKGVFRVNCIDCLDRTNVVQSAFARYVLTQQLGAVALRSPFVSGSEADLIFNDVWANNGDAISRAYAGTSALKGDFTRTGKRDLSGMLNDGVNSLARMYTATFGDWFSQAVIDFMLGYRTKAVFSEFLLKLQSTDPRDLIRLSKIRAEAVATCTSRVLAEGEHLRSGWTLFAPEEVDVKVGLKFEEKVLLLSYDYTLEKVKFYIRVPLGDIVGISKGAYILSPLEESSRDPEQNYGFVITWLTKHEESRATSYSVRNDLPLGSPLTRANSVARGVEMPSLEETSFAAFKVLPVDPARIRRASSSMSDEMQGATTCREAWGDDCRDDIQGFLAEAQRMTSVYAKLEYGMKRLLWLGG
ncbi:SacI homology domain-containing protein [Ephemerocybe angulata]|uniref:SacI homology domain-containing protein n=1 Tax=Ephemerocybe angulata TaxID=980116 RepID=A0A8H6MFB8_9AGAR|nr:SacI homology domain-containing protein [Tulosesus angulatus]